MVTLKGMSPRPLRKTFISCKTGTRHFKRFTSQRDREGIYSYKFSKVNDLRKRKRGTCGIRPPAFCKDGSGGWGAVRRIGKRKIKDVDTQEDTFKAVLGSL